MISDPDDEPAPKKQRKFKKQRKSITTIKIWVGNSDAIFKLFIDYNFEALKLSDYTFLEGVARISGCQSPFHNTIEFELLNTVP